MTNLNLSRSLGVGVNSSNFIPNFSQFLKMVSEIHNTLGDLGQFLLFSVSFQRRVSFSFQGCGKDGFFFCCWIFFWGGSSSSLLVLYPITSLSSTSSFSDSSDTSMVPRLPAPDFWCSLQGTVAVVVSNS